MLRFVWNDSVVGLERGEVELKKKGESTYALCCLLCFTPHSKSLPQGFKQGTL